MKTKTAITFNHMNKYQQDWCIAKAKLDTLREEQKKVESNPLEYERIGRMYMDSISEFKLATVALLTFAKEFVARKMQGHPQLSNVLKMYEDHPHNYLHGDTLPDWWQSKLIDSTLRTNFKN